MATKRELNTKESNPEKEGKKKIINLWKEDKSRKICSKLSSKL